MDYLQNFEKLCPGLVFDYPKDKPKYEKLKEEIDQYSPSPFKNIDTKYNPIYVQAGGYYFLVGERIDVLFRRVLYQLFWYIEAVEQYPDDRVQQSKYLHDEIELAKARFADPKYSIDNLLNDLAYKDIETANKVFSNIIHITNNLIRTLEDGYNFQYRFEFTKSPLFIALMEFVQSINKRAGNIAHIYPEVEAYFENIDSYKDQFKIPPPQEKQNKVPEKYYLLHSLIMIALGKENQFTDTTRDGIQAYGRNKYKLDKAQTFYRWYHNKNIDLLDMAKFVNGLSVKERPHWKKVVIDISGNDSDVITWLKNKPV